MNRCGLSGSLPGRLSGPRRQSLTTAATIIIPTFGRADFVLWALRSAQQQTVRDIEIFVIGDGSAPETAALIKAAGAEDSRVQFFEHEKGERNGEAYRQEALCRARGEIVCYLGHDDLWLPDHVAAMQQLLQGADFAHSLYTSVGADGGICAFAPLIVNSSCRERMLHRKWNRFGPTCAAHTRKIYFELPHGWRPAPSYLWSDLYMWRQFIEQPGCRMAALPKTTAISFPRSQRRDWTMEKREAELKAWFPKLALAGAGERLTQAAVQAAGAALFDDFRAMERLLFKSRGRSAENVRPSRLSLALGRLYLTAEMLVPHAWPGLKHRLLKEIVCRSGLFDRDFYIGYHPGIQVLPVNALAHFLSGGGQQGNAPSPYFDGPAYLSAYEDVYRSGINPLVHFILYGYREGRAAAKLFS